MYKLHNDRRAKKKRAFRKRLIILVVLAVLALVAWAAWTGVREVMAAQTRTKINNPGPVCIPTSDSTAKSYSEVCPDKAKLK